MKNYRVKDEHWDSWFGGLSTEEIGDATVSEDEIRALASSWGKALDELMEQVEEIESATATALNPLGMYDYIVTGARATEAAANLEQRLDSLSRSPFPVAPERTGEIASEVAKTYGVVVTTTIGGVRYE